MGTELAKLNQKIRLAWADADELSDLIEKHEISQVPSILAFHPHKLHPEVKVILKPDQFTAYIE